MTQIICIYSNGNDGFTINKKYDVIDFVNNDARVLDDNGKQNFLLDKEYKSVPTNIELDRKNKERRIKTKIAFHHGHKRSVEVVFRHRMELMPHTKEQCIRHIENTRKECDEKILQLEKELKNLDKE
jgi:hypothetical protein